MAALDFSGLATLTNGYVALTCGVYLLHIYTRWGRRNYFHLFWALGFILYGVGVLFRFSFQVTSLLLGMLFTVSLTMFFIGTGFLFPKLKEVFLIVATITFLVLLAAYSGFSDLLFVVAPIPYMLVASGIILLMKNYGKFFYSFFFGWIFLSIVDLAAFSGFLSWLYADILSILAKVLILYGAVNPMFAMVGVEMQRLLWRTSQAPPVKRSHFTLIKCSKTSHLREISWIKQTVTDNTKKGIKTFLLILYDLISLPELEDLEFLAHEDVHVVRVLRETEKAKLKEEHDIKIFNKERFSVIKDDLTSLGLLISRIVRYSREKNVDCNILVYSLSWLIHTHGWRNIYLLLTYKIPEIKNSQVYLHAFYYPEIHENGVHRSTFEKLAEEIVTI